MDGGHRAAPVDEHAKEGEAEGDVYEGQVPHSEHALPLLHHDGVDEGGEAEPGHQAGVFDGVPGPVTAPAQDGVGPPGPKKQAGAEGGPGDDAPDAGHVHPLVDHLL